METQVFNVIQHLGGAFIGQDFITISDNVFQTGLINNLVDKTQFFGQSFIEDDAADAGLDPSDRLCPGSLTSISARRSITPRS